MKNIDIEKLDRKMPYEPLGDSYFEELSAKTLSKMQCEEAPQQSASSWKLTPKRIAAAITIAAAAVVGGLYLALEFSGNTAISSEEQISDFISALSDSDLEELISDAETSYEFYTNL